MNLYSRVTILVDNRSAPPFVAEHGLSLLVEHNGERLLFDTGAGNALLPNLSFLSIVPGSLTAVVLSHGHNDHTGGLAHLAPTDIWAAPGLARRRFSIHPGKPIHDLTMPEASVRILGRARLHEVGAFTEIRKGVFLTGPIPRLSGEDCGGPFFFDPEGKTPDDIPDEQALLLEDGVLIVGCCHAGLVNTIAFCRRQRPDISIRCVIGGLHLADAGNRRLGMTAACLEREGVRRLVPLHCTGDLAASFLRTALADCEVVMPSAGDSFEP
jgi:7,8-dihydropterin-6-yl-methyl-4-(beta-D-ribofuranosyl)aminobenzene 5'-phosphate synthase